MKKLRKNKIVLFKYLCSVCNRLRYLRRLNHKYNKEERSKGNPGFLCNCDSQSQIVYQNQIRVDNPGEGNPPLFEGKSLPMFNLV